MSCLFVSQPRERVAAYLMKILEQPGLTQWQKRTGEMFKTLILSLNLQSMRLNNGDFKIASDEEVEVIFSFMPRTVSLCAQMQLFDARLMLMSNTKWPVKHFLSC